MLQKINQRGVVGLEAILIVIVLALVGGTGYYVYHANKKTSDTLNGASQVAQSSPQKVHKKKKVAVAPPPAAPKAAVVDDRTAILAAILAYKEKQHRTDQNGQPITYQPTVDNISGINARGSVGNSSGDPTMYLAHKQNGMWQIVYAGLFMATHPALCNQYGMPLSWCSPY